jgi:hypothetical protein
MFVFWLGLFYKDELIPDGDVILVPNSPQVSYIKTNFVKQMSGENELLRVCRSSKRFNRFSSLSSGPIFLSLPAQLLFLYQFNIRISIRAER